MIGKRTVVKVAGVAEKNGNEFLFPINFETFVNTSAKVVSQTKMSNITWHIK